MKEFPITELLPQRPPFVMVDFLTFCEGKVAKTEFEVRQDNVMVDADGVFSLGGMLENMAQTCAARIGYINKKESPLVKIGVVASLKNITVHSYPKVGDVLQTTVEETLGGILNMTLLNAKIECNGAVVAEGEVKVALTNQEIG